MDKNAIKKFAVWARTELIARVSLKGVEYGITEDNIVDAAADSINGKVLTDTEKKQRMACIAEINDKGYKQVMEEVAYTWFNRFSALRFMEVNGYLPSHVRVFTDEENNFKPQIITEAIHLDLDGLDMEKVYAYKDANQTEELYKYLLVVQCNALNAVLPGMFQKIEDYTELLLPDKLLLEGSVIERMIALIPEEDWKDAVQIIGWMYQYYNSEKKDEVLKKYLNLLYQEIAIVNPKVVILFGNQVSSIVLKQNVSVSQCRKQNFSKNIAGKEYKVYPVYYPIGNGMMNIEKAIEDIKYIIETN